METPLSAPLDIAFDYTRSLGPVLGRFVTALRDRRIEGVLGSDGRVYVPPVEYDPVTARPLTEFVPVSEQGTVLSWSWIAEPLDGQPLAHPFAWALIRLDGADTAMLHAVDVNAPEEIHTGLRVRVRWADETSGHIRDIACFVPVGDQEPPAEGRPDSRNGGKNGGKNDTDNDNGTDNETGNDTGNGPVEIMVTPVRLHYRHSVSAEESRFLRGLAQGRLIGQRCPACGKVYLPPRGACPTDGVPTVDEVELPDVGTVTTFCIVNVPFLGQRLKPPYVAAYILLDGADIAFLHLVLGCDAADVRMGMRVRAVWKPPEQWSTTLENIDHFEPTGEPDAPYESFAHHL